MILAAGLGTRLKPWTDHHPKALAIVNGKSLLQRNVEYLQQFGIKEVIVNVHHFSDQIKNAIKINNGWGSNITISDESDLVLETGGGLNKAAWFFDNNDFILMNSDVLTTLDLTSMIGYHKNNSSLATLAITNRSTSRYFLFDEMSTLCGWKNVTTNETRLIRKAENLQQKAFSGIHIINPVIFSKIAFSGKFSMVDLYLDLAKHIEIKGFDHSSSVFIDVGKPEAIAKAEHLFK